LSIVCVPTSNTLNKENHSLLHYLVVWGYDAGIQLLETESTWNTTLENKHKLTPVHFAAYLGRHKFLELFLRKIISQVSRNPIGCNRGGKHNLPPFVIS
jgi:hypothetical protein